MKVAVLGLWHLGSVTAACVSRAGHDVVGWDPDPAIVERLAGGRAPIAEPGLDDVLSASLVSRRLRFTSSLRDAVADADVVWLTFDTPVDEDDRADVESVITHARAALPDLKDGALVISSSQLPVGTVARLERAFNDLSTGRDVGFVSSPENLRLGRALDVFTHPDRIVVGARTARARAAAASLLAPITDRIEWMSVEAAEMTKHAINGFLATSVAFINEVAGLCERVGADAKEVERGLKTDQRIGSGAYVGPGAAFAGGTLARDLVLLAHLGDQFDLAMPLLNGVLESNRRHATWTERTLIHLLGGLPGTTRVAVWGLTYKPGTNTLRRSSSVELCRSLAHSGVAVAAFDPAIDTLPHDLVDVLTLAPDPVSAAAGADALVVATAWPMFRHISADALVGALARPNVVDAGRFLAGSLGSDVRLRYVAVGSTGS